jgi:molecular chaperone GrpE
MSEESKQPQAPGSAPASTPAAGAVAENPADGAAAPPSGPTGPVADVAQLEKEKKEIYDRLLRTAADFDNYKKRSRKEQSEAEDRGRQAVAREMLPVLDNLLRAVAHEAADAGALVSGVRLVIKQFESALERFGVTPFDAVGKPFDPALHEALSQTETDQSAAGTVLAEMQRGYMMGGRLLRPALVVVATPKARGGEAPAGSTADAPSDDGPTGGAPPGQAGEA